MYMRLHLKTTDRGGRGEERGGEGRREKKRREARNKVSLCHKLKEKSQLLSNLSPFVLRGCVPSHLLYLDSELEWQQRGGAVLSIVLFVRRVLTSL